MSRGAKPGERRGGRTKGTPNKFTQGLRKAVAEQQTSPESKPLEGFDSLDQKRKIAVAIINLAVEEQRKSARGEKWDPKWYKDCLEAADRALNGLLPYEHRRLATLEPAMETVVKPDGSVHVTISRTDSEL